MALKQRCRVALGDFAPEVFARSGTRRFPPIRLFSVNVSRHVALAALPKEVAVTCLPVVSGVGHGSPLVHIHTDRLLRRVRVPPVPSTLSSYSVHPLTSFLFWPRLVCPAFGLPLARGLPLLPLVPVSRGGTERRRVSNLGLPYHRIVPRRNVASQVGAVPMSRAVASHPAGFQAALAHFWSVRRRRLRAIQHPRHPVCHRFRGRIPHGPRACVCCFAGRVTAPVAGSLLARAVSPLARRASHPLDDLQDFSNSSLHSIPLDQHCLVALNVLPAHNGTFCSASPSHLARSSVNLTFSWQLPF